MPPSLLEQLPGIVAHGRRQAQDILGGLGGRRPSLRTREWVLPPRDARGGGERGAAAQRPPPPGTADGAAWANRLIDGGGLPAMATLLAGDEYAASLRGRVDLAYVDLPFGAAAAGRADTPPAARGRPRLTVAAPAPAIGPDDEAAYLAAITPQLALLHELLDADGSVFVHLDWHVGHHVKLILDELFGADNFRNEITLPSHAARYLQVRRDHLFWYTKSPAAGFPPLWIQRHEADGPERRWSHFWDPADRPAMRYSLFGITPTIGQWLWQEARALQAVRNYQRFCEEGGGRTIERYWRDTGGTLEFLRPSPDDGVPQRWLPPAGRRTADADGAKGGRHVAGNDEKYLPQLVEFASRNGGIVAGLGDGAGATAAVAERLGRRWLVAGLGETACAAARRRLADQGAGPFLHQAAGG